MKTVYIFSLTCIVFSPVILIFLVSFTSQTETYCPENTVQIIQQDDNIIIFRCEGRKFPKILGEWLTNNQDKRVVSIIHTSVFIHGRPKEYMVLVENKEE